jgi:glycosyltransferase involved in cell wall biosynthesis
MGGIASIRSMNYARYLPTDNIKPLVLTIEPRLTRYPKDCQLLSKIKDTAIYRTKYFDLNWIFKLMWGLRLHKFVRWIQQNVLIPDVESLWLPTARKAIDKIFMDNKDIRLVVTSGGPFSTFKLSKYITNKYSVPYVLEFRDEWTNNPARINLPYPVKSTVKELNWESQLLVDCSGIVYLTEQMQRNFEAKHSFLCGRPSRIIPNGYDDSDFSATSNYVPSDKLHLVYCGSFYDRQQPDTIWSALAHLLDAKLIDANQISIDIYGNNNKNFVLGSFLENPGLIQCIKLFPFISHAQSIQKMLAGDALLLFIASGKNTGATVTGKIFDYMRSGKPILAIVPNNGIAAKMVNESNLGFVADPDDPEMIQKKLLEIYHLWQEGQLSKITPNSAFIQQFNRQNLSHELASLIHEVTHDADE